MANHIMWPQRGWEQPPQNFGCRLSANWPLQWVMGYRGSGEDRVGSKQKNLNKMVRLLSLPPSPFSLSLFLSLLSLSFSLFLFLSLSPILCMPVYFQQEPVWWTIYSAMSGIFCLTSSQLKFHFSFSNVNYLHGNHRSGPTGGRMCVILHLL